MKTRTIVICNGYNVNSPDWELVAWGDPEAGRLGRIPMALQLAQAFGASDIIFDTGASEAEFSQRHGVVSEAMFTKLTALARLNDLRDFPQCCDLDRNWLTNLLLRSCTIEDSSVNTMSAAIEKLPILVELLSDDTSDLINVASVSSRNHARAGHHFEMVLRHGCGPLGPLPCADRMVVSHVCCDTGYADDGLMERMNLAERAHEDVALADLPFVQQVDRYIRGDDPATGRPRSNRFAAFLR